MTLLQRQLQSLEGKGKGGVLGKIDASGLEKAIHAQQDNMAALAKDLVLVSAALKHSSDALDQIPRKLTRAIKSISSSMQRIVEQGNGQARYQVPGKKNFVSPDTPGAVQVKPKTGGKIANIPAAALDKAGVDRIVNAINKQTEILKAGLPVKAGTDATGKGGKGGKRPEETAEKAKGDLDKSFKKAAKAGADAGTLIEASLLELRTNLTKSLKKSGLTGTQLSAAVDAGVDIRRQELKAKARKAERETTGVTRTDQSAQAKKEFKARPSITTEEKAERERLRRLVNSPGSGDFASQASGRVRTPGAGYTLDQLQAMRKAFEALGISVGATSKATKEKLVPALQDAHKRMEQNFPEGHPKLQTSGFAVTKTTKIGEDVKALVGKLKVTGEQLQVAQKELDKYLQAGNRLPKSSPAVPQAPGTIFAPGAVKGSPVYGTAYTGKVASAQAAGQLDPTRAMAQALKLSGNRDFNPYDPKYSKQIETGSGPKAQAEARAYQNALRDLRAASTEIDRVLQKIRELKTGVGANMNRRAVLADRDDSLTRQRSRIAKNDISDPKIGELDKELRETRREAKRVDEALDVLQRDLAATAGSLKRFGVSAKQVGKLASNTDNSALDARSSARSAYEERRARGRETLNDYQLVSSGNVGAIAGSRTAVGSKTLVDNIPGLGQNKKGVFYDKSGEVDPKEIAKINQANSKWTKATNDHIRLTQSGTATQAELDTALHKLEQAANTLAARIARNYNGLAPSMNDLTARVVGPSYDQKPGFVGPRRNASQTIRDPKVAAAEAERQDARDKAQAELKRKFKQDPKEAARLNEQAVDRTSKKLADARKAAADATAAYAAHEKKFLGLSDASQKKFLAMDARLAKLKEKRANLENIAVNAADKPTRSTDEKGRPTLKNNLGSNSIPTDVLGYPSKLGYGEDSGKAKRRLDRQIQNAENARKRAAGGGTLDRDLGKAHEATTKAAQEVKRLEAELLRLSSAEKSTKAKKGEVAATEKVTSVSNGRIAELLKERAAVRASGGYTKGDAKKAFALGESSPEYQDVRARRADIRRINQELKSLGHQSGGGGKGGNKGGSGSGGSGSGSSGSGARDNSLLAQILSTLKAIHTTLQKGVPRTAATTTGQGSSSVPTAPKPRKPQVAVAGGATAEEVKAAQDLSRAERIRGIEQRRTMSEQRRLTRDAKNAASAQRAEGNKTTGADRALREQARAEAFLQEAMGRTSAATRKEIEVLRALAAAAKAATTAEEKLAAQKRISAQQTKIAGALTQELPASQYAAKDRRRLIQSTLNSAGPAVNTSELDGILRSVRSQVNPAAGRRAGDGMGQGMGEGVLGGFARTFGGSTGFFERVLATTGTFIVRNFAAGFVFGLTAVMQEVITQALQAEATFVRVSDALQSTNKDVGDLRSSLAKMSSEYGVALNDTYTTAASLTGLFDNVQDIEAATRISTQLQSISNGALNATEAVGVLASVMSSFEIKDTAGNALSGVDEAEKIADVLTSIQNNLGVNIETSAEGVASMAGLAAQMNLSFEESAVFVAAIAKSTNQTGAAAGEQFSRILASMQTGKGRKAIDEAFGANVTTLIGQNQYGDALKEMIAGWDGLGASQQNNLAVSVAGQRQMRAFQALMNDSVRNLRALDKAENSQGEAAERMEKILKNLQSRLKQLSSTVQALMDQLLQTGILNVVGVAVAGIAGGLQLITNILSKINEVADGNPLLSFLRDAAGFAIGAYIAFRLLSTAINGVRGAIGGRSLLGGTPGAAPLAPGVRGGVPPVTGGVRPPPPATRSGFFGGSPRADRNPAPLRNGFILGALTPGFEKLKKAVDLGGRSIGKWSDNFRPTGRFSQPLNDYGKSLSGRGQRGLSDQRNPRATPIYGNARPPSMFTAPNAALRMQNGTFPTPSGSVDRSRYFNNLDRTNSAQRGGRIAQASMTAMNRSMIFAGRSAQIAAAGMNAAGRAVQGVAAKFGGVSGALKGIGIDVALFGLTLGLMKLAENASRQGRLAEAAAESYERLYGKVSKDRAKKTGEDKNETQYVGPAMEALTAEMKRLRESSTGFFSDIGDAFAIGITNPLATVVSGLGAILSGPTKGGPFDSLQAPKNEAVDKYYEKQYGIDPKTGIGSGQQDVLDVTNKMMNDPKYNIYGDNIKTIEEAAEREAELNAELAKIAENAMKSFEKGDLSGAQYASVLAAVEEGDAAIRQGIDDRVAVLNNMKSGTQLTTDQVKRLLETSSLATQIGTSNGLTTMGGTIDIPLTKILKDKIDSTGIDNDSETYKELQSLLGGQNDLTGTGLDFSKIYPDVNTLSPPSAVDLNRVAVLTTQEAYKQSDNDVKTLQEASASNEQIEAAMAQREQALQAYISAVNTTISTIQTQSDQDSKVQAATGDFRAAMKTQVDGILAADKAFEEQNELLFAPLALAKKIAAKNSRRIKSRATELATGKGPAYDPENIFDVEAKNYNESPDYKAKFDAENTADVDKIQAAIEDTSAYRQQAAIQIAQTNALIQTAILASTSDLNKKIALASTDELKAQLELQRAAIISGMLDSFNEGVIPEGLDVPKDVLKGLKEVIPKYGDAAVENAQQEDAWSALNSAKKSAVESEKSTAKEARDNRAALIQAQLGVRAAWADARGDAVAGAKIQAAMAQASMAAAQAELAAATTASETAQAQIAILNARAQIIGANAGIQAAQTDLIQSQYQVTIALAEAAGKTVLAAQRTLKAARSALRRARGKSGGKNTAEVNAARTEAIRAEAGLRDARLQDDLDTIDFNLQMGRITQSSAISALQQILKTRDLTRDQRRQLLLQIKGMKEEMADSQWNFGDIRLPTPYQMKRYIKEQKYRDEQTAMQAAGTFPNGGVSPYGSTPTAAASSVSSSVSTTSNTFIINGADTAQVKKIITQVVGGGGNTKTVNARRV